MRTAPEEVEARVAALLDERRRLERELAEARKALALGGGVDRQDAPVEQIAGVSFTYQVLEGFDPKGLRALVDQNKQKLGSGANTVISVVDGRATVAVGVTEDLTGRVNAVDLVKVAVEALGGKGGGGRPDMAQGGGPDGDQAEAALAAVRTALAGETVA